MDITTLIHINTLMEREHEAARQEFQSASDDLKAYRKEHDCSVWEDEDEEASEEFRSLKKRLDEARNRKCDASTALNDWYHHEWH